MILSLVLRVGLQTPPNLLQCEGGVASKILLAEVSQMKQLVRLCVPALCCSVVFSGCSATQPGDPKIRGTVTQIRSNAAVSPGVSLLVTDTTRPESTDGGFGNPVWVGVSPSTEVYVSNGRGTIADIKVGASVRAFIEGNVLDSYPAITGARRIEVNLQ